METHIIDYKSVWKDEWFEWLCGYANSKGGTLAIGKNDAGAVIPLSGFAAIRQGTPDYKKLSEDLPNKIRQALGIIPIVEIIGEGGEHYIEITVEKYTSPINYKGKYFRRSGSTNQELTGRELDEFLLKAHGKTWDGASVPKMTIQELDSESLRLFREKAVSHMRLTEEEVAVSDKILLANLNLLNGEELTAAAVLLFHRNPEVLSLGSYVKVAYFENDADFLYHDVIKGSLISLPDKVVDLVYTKYFKGIVSYQGIQRVETFPVPRTSFREAVLNAIVHKDYSRSNAPIQIKIYDDKVIIHNAGHLPENWTIDNLFQEHASVPFNPNIANAFFMSGLIEAWGRGIEKINSALRKAGLPEAEYSAMGDIITIRLKTSLQGQNGPVNEPLNKTENTIIQLIRQDKGLSKADMADRIGVSLATVKRAVKTLCEKGVIQRVGSDKSGYWEILK
ncbi:ATP-dependent DNA helicase [Clostridia bacterium]|nr:ATP-dependent DNA helicase [Clostridia bacterium]